MRRILPLSLGLVALAGFSHSASAQIEKYLFDKPHTQIIFFVDHLGFAKSSGKFLDYTGEIQWDKGEPEKSSVNATIQVNSLDMGDKTWNEHLLADKFFDAAKFPTMTFKSTSIQKTGEKTANITGDLTLHGVTKPVVLATTFNNAGKHPMMDRMEAGFSATAHLKRSDFGMSQYVPMVGDDIDIRIEVEAYKEDKTAAGTENK
jgi:polyisoprenoid-binding protein YceI